MTPFKDNITKSIDNLNKLQEDVETTITDLQEQVEDLEEQIEEMEDLETKNVTITTNTETTIEPTSGKYALEKVVVTTNVEPVLEEKSVTITENTTTNITPSSGYDGISSVAVTTNIQSGNAKAEFPTNENYYYPNQAGGLKSVIKEIELDCTQVMNYSSNDKKTLKYLCMECRSLTKCTLLNTNTVTDFTALFYDCASLTDYTVDFSSAQTLRETFASCGSLANIKEIFDFSNIKTGASSVSEAGLGNMFQYCNNLSETSLEKIVKSLLTAPANYRVKTLAHIGLNSTQATTCTGFDDWATLSANGWTTGY